jgi:hypothetical protein
MKKIVSHTLLLVAVLTPQLIHCFPFWKSKEASAPHTEKVPLSGATTNKVPTLGQFHDAMRQLWNDHGVWTREYVVAALSSAPNTTIVANRLFRNQEDIGNAVAGFYGADAGKALTALLKDHIKVAAAVVTAASKGEKVEFAKQNKLWHKNADDIAAFLSKANPHLTQKGVQKMMYDHLALLTANVTARLKKDWEKDVKSYDVYRAQLNHMADALSGAIAMQFPAKFRKKTPWYKRTRWFAPAKKIEKTN